MPLRLRPYRVDDEADALAAYEALRADEFEFLLSWDPSMSWSDFLSALEDQRLGRNLTHEQVRAVQLVADVDGELVGRVSIRFSLNEFLATRGGHVGYAVVPNQRRKGYASEILRQALVILRAEGVEKVLVTCDEVNVGSALVIEGGGGVYESTAPALDGGTGIRRYWIH
ncbi:MAG TPA: GNAT family N-acetyltransferase [Acidimicrobiales bacterium]|nr:GNAT family N-acetyltransferase [Acidimicrobiales bacterium]